MLVIQKKRAGKSANLTRPEDWIPRPSYRKGNTFCVLRMLPQKLIQSRILVIQRNPLSQLPKVFIIWLRYDLSAYALNEKD